MKDIITKAEILIEALPYIRNFYGKSFVIKYGGAAQVKEELKESFAKDIALLNFIGIKTTIVHGGGPKISATMEKMGKKPKFVQGQRVTDQETMDIVEMVLGGLVNKEIVSLINNHGGKAVGLSGKDAGLIKAKKKLINKSSAKGVDEIIDIGLVGEVTQVDPHIIISLEKEGFVPVISPVGVGPKGETLNIIVNVKDLRILSKTDGRIEIELMLDYHDQRLDKKGQVIGSTPRHDFVRNYTVVNNKGRWLVD